MQNTQCNRWSASSTEIGSWKTLISSTISSNEINEWKLIVPHRSWVEEPFCPHNAVNWKSHMYFVIWISILEAHVFTVKNRSFPNSFWQNSPLLWLALRNNSWLHGKYCGAHSTKCNITQESNDGSIYLKKWYSRILEHNNFGWVSVCVFTCSAIPAPSWVYVGGVISGPPQIITQKGAAVSLAT